MVLPPCATAQDPMRSFPIDWKIQIDCTRTRTVRKAPINPGSGHLEGWGLFSPILQELPHPEETASFDTPPPHT